MGVIRDVVQNHLFQIVSYLAMEAPSSIDPDAIHDEQAKVLRTIRPMNAQTVTRGQFRGYRDEPGVAKDSHVATYAALRLDVDSWRWAGVPFYIRAGKCLKRTVTEVLVELKLPPQVVFAEATPSKGNYLRFRLSPQVAIAVGARVKRPGEAMAGQHIELSLMEQPAEMRLGDYERLLGDAISRRHHALRATGRRGSRVGRSSIRCWPIRARCSSTSPVRGGRHRPTSSSPKLAAGTHRNEGRERSSAGGRRRRRAEWRRTVCRGREGVCRTGTQVRRCAVGRSDARGAVRSSCFGRGPARGASPGRNASSFSATSGTSHRITPTATIEWRTRHCCRGCRSIPPRCFESRESSRAPNRAALEYEQAIRGFFRLSPDKLPRFDLVMLGLGSDGHIASLFPGTPALDERERLVTANWVERFGAYRITLTVPVLNEASRVILLVQGAEKASALEAVLHGRFEPRQLPAQLIDPRSGTLSWLVDRAAANEHHLSQ